MWCLDEWLTSELRTAVRSANLYRFDEKVKAEYSLICAVADRVQDADRWLNKHAQLPTNEVDALTWLMLASVIKSSVESLCKKFGVRFNDNDAQSQDNDNAIKEYRQKILELASVLCDEIENLNYEDFTRRLEHVTGCHWDTLPSGISYHTEKVFEYFDGCNNASREWGRQDLLALSADYVGRWVKIDYAMPDVEIRMLVTLAYYMEYGRYRKLELFEEEVSRKRNCLHHKMEMMQDAAGRCVDVRFVEETCGRLDVKPPVAN